MKANIIHSNNPLENSLFPYLALEIKESNCNPNNKGFRLLHWHEELQFIFVLKGVIIIRTLEETIQLEQGQGAFINKGLLHETTEKIDCHYRSFIFSEKFITFYAGSHMEKYDVKSITENLGLQVLQFRPGRQWEEKVLKGLKVLSDIEDNKIREGHYEYRVSMELVGIWYLIISNLDLKEKLGVLKSNTSNRIRQFIVYISNNYTKDLSLEDIAKSGNVSKSECNRCFKAGLNTTAYRYLIEYRLNKSLTLITNTNLSITEICYGVGFNNTSHYIKKFKYYFNMTPLEYRLESLKKN